MSKSKYAPEQRATIAQEYLDEKGSSIELAKKYKIGSWTIRRWALSYKEHGIFAFLKKDTSYTEEFKLSCAKLYLEGKMSLPKIVAKYNLSSDTILRRWILSYNASRNHKDNNPKKEVYMAGNKRKTTIDERKEIVKYCLEHNHNYKETANMYNVSYYQIYSWMKKYETSGEDGLLDNRGHHKTENELDEIEKLKRENMRLKKELKEKDMIVELIKKVKEFERK